MYGRECRNYGSGTLASSTSKGNMTDIEIKITLPSTETASIQMEHKNLSAIVYLPENSVIKITKAFHKLTEDVKRKRRIGEL